MPVKIDLTQYPEEYRKEMILWIKSLDISLANNTKKTMMTLTEWIQKMIIAGVEDAEIERRVSKAFTTGTGAFATFRNTFLRRTLGTMNLIERVPRDVEKESDKRYTWICMHSNSCDDCVELHGETKKWSEWLDIGLPGSGHTACQDNCNCDLVDEGSAQSPALKEAINLAEERRKEIVESGGAVHVKGKI